MAGERETGRGYGRAVASRAGRRDPDDPAWRAVELAQRGRMILDVTAADLEAAEAALGPFHPTTWHFRNAWYEARRSWDRLRAEVGGARLEAALEEPPVTVLALGPGADAYGPGPDGRWPALGPAQTRPVVLIPITGRTYRALRVAGTALAPTIWCLTRLRPVADRPRDGHDHDQDHDGGHYYACRLCDGSTQCDCAEWTYRVAGTDRPGPMGPLCKHLAALVALGWIGRAGAEG
jgi:hypothetical protein